MLGHVREVSTPGALWIISKTLQSVTRIDRASGETERIILGTEVIYIKRFDSILPRTHNRLPREVCDRIDGLRRDLSYKRKEKERNDRLRSKQNKKLGIRH